MRYCHTVDAGSDVRVWIALSNAGHVYANIFDEKHVHFQAKTAWEMSMDWVHPQGRANRQIWRFGEMPIFFATPLKQATVSSRRFIFEG